MLSKIKIKKILNQFSSIGFLEDEQKTKSRYENKYIILFKYSFKNEFRVLKYYSLEHLKSSRKEEEKQHIVNEFNIAKRFRNHDNVIKTYDIGLVEINGEVMGVYITMEFFPTILNNLIKKIGKFRETEIVSFLKQMSIVLETAHYKLSEPIVHSDIKPANIGVRKLADGSLQYALMDFDVSIGLKKMRKDDETFTLTNKGVLKGLTPAYAAPEQILAKINQSNTVTTRVDIFSVGAVAMEMLTGKAPRAVENDIFYHLPFEHIKSKWYAVFSSLCNPEANKRVKIVANSLRHLHVKSEQRSHSKVSLVKVFIFLISVVVMGAVFLFMYMYTSVSEVKSVSTDSNYEEFQSSSVNIPVEEVPIGDLPAEIVPVVEEVEEVIDEVEADHYIPNLIGKELNSAKSQLQNLGFIVEVIYQDSPYNRNKVIDMNPKPGDILTTGNTIKLLIGK